MSDNLVVVHVESEETKARVAIGFLQSRGIDARILEDDLGDQVPSLESTHGVKILVPEEQADRARAVLREQHAAAAEQPESDG